MFPFLHFTIQFLPWLEDTLSMSRDAHSNIFNKIQIQHYRKIATKMAADWTGRLNNTATCVARKGITSCRASINAVETPILCYSEVMVMCDSARRERHVRAIISRCLCVALTKWLKRATTGCFSFKMLFSVIICVSGFIFSAFLRLVNMSVPFNPLLTQAPLQTALRLTERERESA